MRVLLFMDGGMVLRVFRKGKQKKVENMGNSSDDENRTKKMCLLLFLRDGMKDFQKGKQEG